MKLITLNQLVSSLETTKEYIDKAVGNISAGSNIDTNDLVITNSISMGREEGSTIGVRSVAVGSNVTASGDYSHAEGFYTEANNNYSHAEGESTTASGHASHAEGNITEASGDYSHAEGFETIASGDYSHTEGDTTTASGESSHAEGYGTIASSEYQHVQGKCNIEDSAGTYAHIVGNGSSSARSNAHTLDWNGNAWFAGNVKVGADNKELATTDHTHTKAEIENKLTGLIGSHHHDWSTTKGTNTISSTSNDTTSSWGAQGHSIHWYTQTGLLNDQPNQWGYILNLGNGTEVHQMWFTQASGSLYHRGGNASGWSGSWRTILDSSNYETYVPKSSESDHYDVYAWVNSDGKTNVGNLITFHNGIYDENGDSPKLGGGCTEMDGSPSSNILFSYASLLPWTVDYFDLGDSNFPWYYCYTYGGVKSGSDRTMKENINYIRNNEVSTLSLEDDNGSDGITYSDMYNFIKEDLELATYNFKDKPEEDVQMNFIAQDLLYNLDGTDNKVGQFIVKPKASLTEEEAEAEIEKIETKFNRELNDNEKDRISSPKLDYDRTNFTSVLAGALKETIKQIEELKEIVNQQQELINQLLNN